MTSNLFLALKQYSIVETVVLSDRPSYVLFNNIVSSIASDVTLFFTILLLNHKNTIWLMAIYWLKFKVCFNAQCFKLFAYVSYSPPMHMALSNP